MKLLYSITICSLLINSMVSHAMFGHITQGDMRRWKQENQYREQWEKDHPGEYYQAECSPVRMLKPGYTINAAGEVVPEANVCVNNEVAAAVLAANAHKEAQTKAIEKSDQN